MEKVWVLEEGVNDYNQHGDYVRCVWKDKPKLEEVARVLCLNFPAEDDETTLNIVNIWKGQKVRIGESDWSIGQRQLGVMQEE